MTQINSFHHPDDIQTYQSGEVIFKQGDAGKFMYDVISGEVVLNRNEQELTRLQKGDIFGETGLINNQPHSVTATAVSNCEIAKISKRRFMFMVDETPGFALNVMRVLAQRLSLETAKHS